MVELHTLGILWLFHWQCHVRCDSYRRDCTANVEKKAALLDLKGIGSNNLAVLCLSYKTLTHTWKQTLLILISKMIIEFQ